MSFSFKHAAGTLFAAVLILGATGAVLATPPPQPMRVEIVPALANQLSAPHPFQTPPCAHQGRFGVVPCGTPSPFPSHRPPSPRPSGHPTPAARIGNPPVTQ